MRAPVLLACLVLYGIVPCVARADEPGISLTIYGDNLALVQDHRTIDVAGGRQRIEFQNVSAQIRPETVSLAANDLTIVEQNFDFDLLTPSKLMEKAVGKQVQIVIAEHAQGIVGQVAHQPQCLQGVGPAVDQVADEPDLIPIALEADPRNQRGELIGTALDIAYGPAH